MVEHRPAGIMSAPATTKGPTQVVGEAGTRCSACGRAAFYGARQHVLIPGLGFRPGCDSVFVAVAVAHDGTADAELQARDLADELDLPYAGRQPASERTS